MKLEDFFEILSENVAWKKLLIATRVSGVQVHDARLVVLMKTYGIPQMLTFNVSDFARFTDIEAVHPETSGNRPSPL